CCARRSGRAPCAGAAIERTAPPPVPDATTAPAAAVTASGSDAL
ncbi:MAG: hypothetical protein AVDCRST_MAG07-1426, partial [uncultured Frankineae bacterium]